MAILKRVPNSLVRPLLAWAVGLNFAGLLALFVVSWTQGASGAVSLAIGSVAFSAGILISVLGSSGVRALSEQDRSGPRVEATDGYN